MFGPKISAHALGAGIKPVSWGLFVRLAMKRRQS